MTTWQTRFDECLEQLSWGFETGDDGDLLTLAFDEIASVLSEIPVLQAADSSSLEALLEEAGADAALVVQIKRLSKIGQAANYGDGLDAQDAKYVSEVAEDVVEALQVFAKKQRARRRKRGKLTGTAANGSRKR